MRQVILLIGAMVLISTAYAQNYGSLLLDKVNAAYNNGAEFSAVNLFSNAGIQSNNFAKQYCVYKPNEAVIKKVYAGKPNTISFDLLDATGKVYTIELIRTQPTSVDVRMGYINESGRHAAEYVAVLHYQGVVKGRKKSVAAISVFANGDVMMFFSCEEGNFNLGKIKDGSGDYILYNTKDRLEEIPVTCHVTDSNAQPIDTRAANKTTGDIECRKARIYWEVGFDIYTTLGGLTATQNYLTGVFNFMQSIYYNDGMAIEMSSMYIWTITDPYTRSHTSDAQFHFQRYWFTQKDSYHGDQAQLILDGVGYQGYGTVYGLCAGAAYAASNLWGSRQGNYPVWDLDIYIVSHETGHTFGAQHSHWCGWMTGAGGTCGAVDNCTTLENWGLPGCTNCTALYDANGSNFKGTIMSYCGGKLNFSEGFGAIIGSYLRNKISNASCLQPVISKELTVQDICNSDGAITLSYKANNFGVAPYTYAWSNSANTKDISGLSAPGKYSVTIIDSNGCTITDTAELNYYAKPGDGNALPGTMPYCCKDTLFDVTISAALPVHLTQCQTVAWLRTAQPITSYADARTAYTSANQNDILPSDNDTLINNATNAQLTISSPASCTTTTAHYYTPFVTRKTTNKQVYTTNASGTTTLKNGVPVLGYTLTIPAEPSLPAVCESAVPNVTDTITVTISNYTGRANKLIIRVVGEENIELFEKTDFAGDGVYQIPITTTSDHFQQMKVYALDFNCSAATTCTSCSFNIQAKREVTYHEMPALTFDSSCVAGASVYLSFGPDNCKVDIDDIAGNVANISLLPNPAQNNVTLQYDALSSGDGWIRITDISGRIIHARSVSYRRGVNSELFNLAGMAKGMYFVSLEDNGYQHNMKLLVR